MKHRISKNDWLTLGAAGFGLMPPAFIAGLYAVGRIDGLESVPAILASAGFYLSTLFFIFELRDRAKRFERNQKRIARWCERITHQCTDNEALIWNLQQEVRKAK